MNTRNYVVIARFDNETTAKLDSLQKRLYETGYIDAISEWPPHITIAAYEDIDIDLLLNWTEEFSAKYTPFNIILASLGVFPPGGEHTNTVVLYASPALSESLIDFYYAFHKKLDDYCRRLGWFYSAKFGHPVIHSTIGVFKVTQMQKALEIIFEKRIFGMAKIIV